MFVVIRCGCSLCWLLSAFFLLVLGVVCRCYVLRVVVLCVPFVFRCLSSFVFCLFVVCGYLLYVGFRGGCNTLLVVACCPLLMFICWLLSAIVCGLMCFFLVVGC